VLALAVVLGGAGARAVPPTGGGSDGENLVQDGILAPDATPSDATLLYLNARLALREDRPTDALRLWFARNTLRSETGRISVHDADFHSVAWAALGALGLCQDGLRKDPRDAGGAGLWPLALHNQVVRTRGRRSKGGRIRPYRAFDAGRQVRRISIDDVLDREELRTLELSRGFCLGPRLRLLALAEDPRRLDDREAVAQLLETLIRRAWETLSPRVRGLAVLEARLFDLGLQRMALAARAARQEARERGRDAAADGLSRTDVAAVLADAPATTLPEDSEPYRILVGAGRWTAEDWMALEPERRRFLYDQARAVAEDTSLLDASALGVVDALVTAGEGEQVADWVARAPRDAVWPGERGRSLLALSPEDGFRERSVVALHRGVDLLERGELDPALRTLALAVRTAPESRLAPEVRGLALRWLSYVTARYETTPTLLVTLQELLPTRAYSQVLEDLMWSAAFRADRASFETGLDHQVGRGALGRRLEALAPLARGEGDTFLDDMDEGLRERPGETVRTLEALVARLSLEEPAVIRSRRPVLEGLTAALEPLADPAAGDRQARRARTLRGELIALLEGTGGLGPDASVRDRAQASDATAEIFAGSVRLAPSDPLPWPFEVQPAQAPPAFSPIELVPVEWRDKDGRWVLGWSLRG